MRDLDTEMTGTTGQIAPGTRVDVRTRYVGTWSRGFEVAEHVKGNGYRVKRVSDGSILPEPFSSEEVRLEHRKQGLWWN
ncbi:MAG: hypothetical protein ACRDV4_09960 [Acidimicrobiales bacterium]